MLVLTGCWLYDWLKTGWLTDWETGGLTGWLTGWEFWIIELVAWTFCWYTGGGGT